MASGKTSASNKYAVPAVEQMLDIVEHLAQNHRPYGITELARQLGISTNGVFRILRCRSFFCIYFFNVFFHGTAVSVIVK